MPLQAYFHVNLLNQLKVLSKNEIILRKVNAFLILNENLKRKVKYVVKIQHSVHLIKIIGFLKKNRPYLYIKTVFIINNKQKQTKEKYD